MNVESPFSADSLTLSFVSVISVSCLTSVILKLSKQIKNIYQIYRVDFVFVLQTTQQLQKQTQHLTSATREPLSKTTFDLSTLRKFVCQDY